LKKNTGDRLKLSIDALKEEVSASLSKTQEVLLEQIERVQHEVENYEPRIQKLSLDIDEMS